MHTPDGPALATLAATLTLAVPTLVLGRHLVGSAVAARRDPGTREADWLDLPLVGLGFAICLSSLGLGRIAAGHDAVAGIGLAALVTFPGVIASGFWAHGARAGWSASQILLASAAAGLLLGACAPSW